MIGGDPAAKVACTCESKIAEYDDDKKKWKCYKTGLDKIVSYAVNLMPSEHIRIDNREFVRCSNPMK